MSAIVMEAEPGSRPLTDLPKAIKNYHNVTRASWNCLAERGAQPTKNKAVHSLIADGLQNQPHRSWYPTLTENH